MIVHDAAVAVTAVIAAAVAMVQLAAGLAAIVLCALPLCVGPGVRAARRGLRARLSREQPQPAPEPQPAPQRRPMPSWAHTEPYDHEDAA